jgi:hypothetical protein
MSVGSPLAEEKLQHLAAPIHRQALAAGKWQSQRGSALKRDWQVQIKHSDDGVISGRVLIAGGRWAQVRLEGRVDGDEVYGVLLDDAGREVGDFSGSVGKSAASGTYRMKDGDEGNWSAAMGSAPAIGAASSNQIPATPAPVDELGGSAALAAQVPLPQGEELMANWLKGHDEQ